MECREQVNAILETIDSKESQQNQEFEPFYMCATGLGIGFFEFHMDESNFEGQIFLISKFVLSSPKTTPNHGKHSS